MGGSVPSDASPIDGDPQATLQKAQQVRRAALAPADPSAADRSIAAAADAVAAQARAEITAQRSEQTQEASGESETPGEDTSPESAENATAPTASPLSDNEDNPFATDADDEDDPFALDATRTDGQSLNPAQDTADQTAGGQDVANRGTADDGETPFSVPPPDDGPASAVEPPSTPRVLGGAVAPPPPPQFFSISV